MQGTLCRAEIEPLRRQLDQTLGSAPRPAELLFDLEQVIRCDIGACRTLALIQRGIAALGIRTVYLTDRPRVHGAAWWIVHASEDPHAMPVIDIKQAEDWLTGTTARLDPLVERSTRAHAGTDAASAQ